MRDRLKALAARAALAAAAPADGQLADRFRHLSANGNSSCSGAFRAAIARMPAVARLQGSCCSPMTLHRYGEQIAGLREYGAIAAIPPDPYDIEAGHAKELIGYFSLELTPEERAHYDYAVANSNEKGPCCCGCWRWEVYGGLGKHLIRELGFTGEQVAEVWDLSDGCGGDGEHLH